MSLSVFTKRLQARIEFEEIPGYRPGRLAISPDENILAAFVKDKKGLEAMALFQVSTGTHLHTLYGHSNPLMSLVFSNDGSRLFTGSTDSTVKVWDVSAGRELLSLPFWGKIALGLHFSGDTQQLLCHGANHVSIWSGELPR